MTKNYGRDSFGNMDDIFNQLMGNIGGYQTENRRYLVNGREMTPEEFNHYRQTGKIPNQISNETGHSKQQAASNGILEKLGTNLTEEARKGNLDPVIGRNKEIQDTAEILSRRTKIILFWLVMRELEKLLLLKA